MNTAPPVAPRVARRSPWHIVSVMLVTVALLITGAILPDGMGAFSLWRDSAAFAITDHMHTGEARLLTSTTPTYLRDGSLYDPAHDTLNPGETLTVSFDTTVRVTGDTLNPTFELSGYTIPVSVRDQFTVTVTAPGLVVSPDEQTVTVTITITSTPDAVFSGEVIDLAHAALTLQSGKGWTDTLTPLTVPLQDIHLYAPIMQLVYNTDVPGGTVNAVLPVGGLTLGPVTVDWGDGTTPTVVVSTYPTHTYAAGTYTITISGKFNTYGSTSTAVTASNKSITSVPVWGANGVTDATYAFRAASNLTSVAAPPTTVTVLSGMFYQATAFNGDITGWDVSNVTTMNSMFYGASTFNQPIGDWNVANVKNMGSMFQNAIAFAQDLSAWDVETNLPTMPTGWNTSAPGLNAAHLERWPLPWQESVMQLVYDTQAPGGTTAAALPIIGLTLGAVMVDWGDGTTPTNVVSANPTHTYAAGTYTITIIGKFTGYGTSATAVLASNKSITSVPMWGENGVTNASSSFDLATNLTSVAEPPATVTSMANMFSGASSFNGDITGWDMSHVTSLTQMFINATSFNQPIGGWDVSNVTAMLGMFSGASAFAQDLSAWDVEAKIPKMPADWNMNVPGLSIANYARWPLSWQNIMQLTYNTAATGGTVNARLPIGGFALGAVTVNWGDGNATTVTTPNPTHTYAAAGTYTITIRGSFTTYGSSDSAVLASNKSITAVSVWGPNGVTNASYAFYGASNLTSVAQPPATVTSMDSMFYNATSFNGAIGDWDVSHVTNMLTMFRGASAFNGAIGDWDVSNVTNMSGMFQNASAFAQNLSAWDVATKLPTMPADWNTNAPGLSTANYARWPIPWQNVMQITYNPAVTSGTVNAVLPIDGLTLGTVTVDWGDGSGVQTVTAPNPTHTYSGTAARTITIYGSFTSYGSSDAPITASNKSITTVPLWGPNGVTTVDSAFYLATNLTSVAAPPTTVTKMSSMFRGASMFNQNIGGWNVSNVTDMSFMFQGAASFNQNIGVWDVANVTDMNQMFTDAKLFNGAIGGWNVTNVTNMTNMFNGATAFAQSLSAWNVAKIPTMPSGWNTNAPGLSTANKARWPLAWQ